MSKTTGGFTMPGEAGYEDLTLRLAKKWGADVIRDSDGTELSPEIVDAGYGIYSTICLIRDHNEWIRKHPEARQQCFLMTEPRVAVAGEELTIPLLADFFEEQFEVNDSREALGWWQVYDRTENRLLTETEWEYHKEEQTVTLAGAADWHEYTVSFLAYRIWEEISMYNHTTNNWQKEHLMQLDARYPEAQEYLLQWMKEWCEAHPATTVVRFTSMFYNFVWIWGSSERLRNRFTDWGSYDFTVSVLALEQFQKQYGYAMTAEDFVNQGKLHVSHMPRTQKKKDWMQFVNDFVVDFGKQLVDLVHSYGKKAYVFYDDSWVGTEPYGKRFPEMGFDGMIKCVFSGFECRLCAGVPAQTHEIRLHPYLFPVGLGGAPTFMEGGDPVKDAKGYWMHVRRALLREKIDRIGLGGYLHLTEDFPEFQDYIEEISDEFRQIRELFSAGNPETLPIRVGVLHDWGSLRSWTLSGHFHETYMHDLIHINEALSGLPVEVKFFDFEQVKKGALEQVDVVINAGIAGSAWSGGSAWKEEELVRVLTKWVYEGGVFLGVGEPSAWAGAHRYFRMAQVLGIDEDTGDRVCHGRMTWERENVEGLFPKNSFVHGKHRELYLTDETTKVLAEDDGKPALTAHSFGKGMGLYLASFETTTENNRLLLNLLIYGTKLEHPVYVTDKAETECAYFAKKKELVVINQTEETVETTVALPEGDVTVTIPAFGSVFQNL